MAWEAIDYISECLSEAAKVGSTASVSETVYWSYPILPFGIVVCTFFPTAFLEIVVYTCKINTNLLDALLVWTLFSQD